MTRLPVCGPEGPIRARTDSREPSPVRAVLFDFSGTLFQIGTYADRIRAALAEPVNETAMDVVPNGLEVGLSDPDVVEAQRGRDVSSGAHRHAFTTRYTSVPELAPVADVLYGQLRSPEHWVHSYEHHTEKPDPSLFRHACRELGVDPGETLMVGDHPAKDGGAAGAGLRSYVLPGGAAPGPARELDAMLPPAEVR